MPTAPSRPATAADVAARAGVSRATVSHIFTGRGKNFTASTRERVLQAAAELDYRPSPAGRSLVLGRGDTIIALVPKATIGQNHLDALDRLAADTAGFGANVVLRVADDDPDQTVSAILRMRPLAVVSLGVDLPSPARERLAAQGVPLAPSSDAAEPPARRFDDLIAETQVSELVRHQPRRIVYVSLDDGMPDAWSPARIAAIAHACERRGLDRPAAVRLSREPGAAAAALEEAFGSPPVGIAAFNDAAAIAAVNLAVRRGFRVPDDVAVIGVDATPLAQLVTPRLTTIDVNMAGFMDDVVAQLSHDLRLEIPLDRLPRSEPFRLIRGEST